MTAPFISSVASIQKVMVKYYRHCVKAKHIGNCSYPYSLYCGLVICWIIFICMGNLLDHRIISSKAFLHIVMLDPNVTRAWACNCSIKVYIIMTPFSLCIDTEQPALVGCALSREDWTLQRALPTSIILWDKYRYYNVV